MSKFLYSIKIIKQPEYKFGNLLIAVDRPRQTA